MIQNQKKSQIWRTATSSINKKTTRIAFNARSLGLYISQFLGTSKGRDKCMALCQYLFDFYHSCAKHTNIPEIREMFEYNQLKSVKFAENLKESISQARKIYRICRFLDEIKGIQRVYKQNKPTLFKLLAFSGHFASFMYYLSDNILWIIGLLVSSEVCSMTREHAWKDHKNSFSLMRVSVNIVRLLVLLALREIKENKLQYDLKNNNEILEDDKRLMKCSQSLIKLRRKKRFETLDLLLSTLRLCMLIKSLKMTGYNYLDPIFVAGCGVISATLALFKAVYEKKIFIQLDRSNQNDQKHERQARRINFAYGSTLNLLEV